MATAKSLADLNWLAKTFAPPRVAAWGMTQIAADLEASPQINSSPRLNNAIDYMRARELDVWAIWTMDWEPKWVDAGEPLFVEFVAAMPADMWVGIAADPDQTAMRALKQFLRSLEMLFLQFLVLGV